MKSPLNYLITAFVLVFTTACSGVDQQSGGADIRQKVAQAYGIQSFGQIEQIQYTFNVQLGDKNVSRSWIWQPKVDEVTFKADINAQPITYSRKKISAAAPDNLKKVDGWFINDNYWLLFPIHMAWDKQAKVEDVGRKDLPMGGGKARCLVVSYPSEGGYTPGDVYELFLDDSFRITQWIYRKGGSTVPTRIASWDDHRRVGPLVLSLNHQGADKNFRVWFSKVAVKTIGSAGLIYAD
ncbi:MAG: hypothetical protein JSW26_06425 [Desulfobacterales bacterium]|nr:MAG: hypothetical protein JSW26_06425 [Desulfobacterales bacterium]